MGGRAYRRLWITVGLELPPSEARSSCLPTLQKPPSGALAEAADFHV